jgi:hypothetical protein
MEAAMKAKRLSPNLLLAVLLYSLLLAPFCSAKHGLRRTPQPSPQKPAQSYPNTTEGLRHLLQAMLAAARAGDQPQLKALTKNTEIPNYQQWLPATFGSEKGKSWVVPYGNMLSQKESEFQTRMTQLAQQQGDFSVREIPPTDMYDTLQTPLDVYLANWNPPSAAGDLPRRPTPIAYFFFVDGAFRWNSLASFTPPS